MSPTYIVRPRTAMSSQLIASAPVTATSRRSLPRRSSPNSRGASPESLCVQRVPDRESASPETSVGPAASTLPTLRTLSSVQSAGVGAGVAVRSTGAGVSARGGEGEDDPPHPASPATTPASAAENRRAAPPARHRRAAPPARDRRGGPAPRVTPRPARLRDALVAGRRGREAAAPALLDELAEVRRAARARRDA